MRSELQSVEECCRMLQNVAVCCRVLQCVAAVLQCAAARSTHGTRMNESAQKPVVSAQRLAVCCRAL